MSQDLPALAPWLERLDAAGLALDLPGVLDALWLASQGRSLTLPGPAATAVQGDGGPPQGLGDTDSGGSSLPRRTSRSASTEGYGPGEGAQEVFPKDQDAAPGTASIEGSSRASSVTLAAPRPLGNRLALMRALRPLAQRRPSQQAQELDEDATVELSARLGRHGAISFMPVLRPRRERWYDVDLVLEDDDGIELWEDALRELARLMADTGAFGQVRLWRLRLAREAGGRPWLENPLGARHSPASLLGRGVNRLIVFASNGVSARWTDGSYAALLAPWQRDNSVVLLQLMPEDRWNRTRLGEPQGLGSAPQAGAWAAALHTQAFWWRAAPQEDGPALALPVMALEPASIGAWARMQMARGPGSPVYLLQRPASQCDPEDPQDPARDEVEPFDVRKAVAQLMHEAPEAFRLGVLLCTAPFTIAVARMVQAIRFEGASAHDPGLLAGLMHSGLVVRPRGRPQAGDRLRSSYFGIRGDAQPLLLRSLRGRDAAELGAQLKAQLSEWLQRLGPSAGREAQLVPDALGRHAIPPWAQPFADVADALLGLPARSRAAPVAPKALRPPAGMTRAQCRYLFMALSLLQSMALGFHVGQLGPDNRRARDELTDWERPQFNALSHWVYMAEYIFAGPVRELLATGLDPLQQTDPDDARQRYAGWLEEAGQWMPDLSARANSTLWMPTSLRALQTAIRVAEAREPQRFAQLASGNLARTIAAFTELAGETTRAEAPRLWALIIDERALVIAWLQRKEVAELLQPYCNPFYEGLGDAGFSPLVQQSDYAGYLAALLQVWRAASQDLFERYPGPDVVLGYKVPRLQIERAGQLLEGHDIRVARERSSSQDLDFGSDDEDVRWTLPRADYLALIDKLGGRVVEAVAARLSRAPHEPTILWVDDRPGNTEQEARQLARRLHARTEYARSTDEALERLQGQFFDVIVSDMGRPPDSLAGYTLLAALQSRGDSTPFIIYSRGQTAQTRKMAEERGALGSTDRSDMLEELVSEAILMGPGFLALPLDGGSLSRYLAWRFPGKEQHPDWPPRMVATLDPRRYPTLLQIDDALERAWDALAAVSAQSPEPFRSGAEYLSAALLYTDEAFRKSRALDEQALLAFRAHAHLVRP